MMFVCSHCSKLVHDNSDTTEEETSLEDEKELKFNPHERGDETTTKTAGGNGHEEGVASSSTSRQPWCSICLGVFQPDFQDKLQSAIDQALDTYTGNYHDKSNEDSAENAGWNRISRRASPPAILLPGDVVYRFCCAVATKRKEEKQQNHSEPAQMTTRDPETSQASNKVEDFVNCIKLQAKSSLLQCVDNVEQSRCCSEHVSRCDYPECVWDEEAGHLGIHVVVVPTEEIQRPKEGLDSSETNRKSRKISRKIKQMLAMEGPPPQGGDPRQNLEWRLMNKGNDSLMLWTLNQAVEKEASFVDTELTSFLQNDPPVNDRTHALDFHVAIWRRPFYLGSCYTKTRRDVSQTPFFVSEQGKRRRLGVTSVEEQILPAVKRACRGISTVNNKSLYTDNDRSGTAPTPIVAYGAAKFHASGREDMDVRMIVPALHEVSTTKHKVSGRPFVCEVIDALSMPSKSALQQIVRDINQPQHSETSSSYVNSYGNNPLGVGISPNLEFVSASSFKTLQAQTESKVKHYGCLCWCRTELPQDEDTLNSLLGTFPLELQQRTPIRVLHRRSNLVRTRHVLTCRATRIDNHYFRLRLSTDAGTCK